MAFHDTSRSGRIPTITDYHGYTLDPKLHTLSPQL